MFGGRDIGGLSGSLVRRRSDRRGWDSRSGRGRVGCSGSISRRIHGVGRGRRVQSSGRVVGSIISELIWGKYRVVSV